MINKLIDERILRFLKSKVIVRVVDKPLITGKINGQEYRIEIPCAIAIRINRLQEDLEEFVNEKIIKKGITSIYLYTALPGKPYEEYLNDNNNRSEFQQKINLEWDCLYLRYYEAKIV